MATTTVKKGDTGPALLRQLYQGGAAFDVSASTYSILVSGESDADGTSLYSSRDVTTTAKANGVPASGKLAIPIWDGRTSSGTAATVNVVDKTADGKVNVRAAAGGSGTVTQELYRTTAGGSTYYFLASFNDGTYAASDYVDNLSDADLIVSTATKPATNPHTDDQSATNGSSALPAAPTPTVGLAGAGAGNVDNGVHGYKVVNKRASDTDTVRKIRWEVLVRNNASGGVTTFPESGFEYLDVVDDI